MYTKLFYTLICTMVMNGSVYATNPQYTKFDSGTTRRTASTCCPAPIQPVVDSLFSCFMTCFTSTGPAPVARSKGAQLALGDLEAQRARIERQVKELGTAPGPLNQKRYAELITEMDSIQKGLENLPSPTGDHLSDLRRRTNQLPPKFSNIKINWAQ